MSEEGGSTNENANLSGNEVSTLIPTEPEILAPLTEGGVGEGIVEAVTEEAMGEQQLRPQKQGKPKKQAKNTIIKIQKSLADTSKQIEKQTAKINKINQNLHTLQKQFKSRQKQSEMLIQMCYQMNHIQRQIYQVQEHQKKIIITT
jgi:predicted RNase H-like nuclease (RuvC/YqgF family)